MKNNILFLTLWLLLAACGGQDGQQEDNAGDRTYRTTAPSLLYFKNMRSSYYTLNEQPRTRIELYRLRKFVQLSGEEIVLVPVIANNWMKDEAYLFLESPELGKGLASPITIRWEAQGDTGLYQLQPATIDKQYELAMQLYKSLLEGHQIEALAADSTWAPIFTGKDSRSHFITSVRDYLRLTEAL